MGNVPAKETRSRSSSSVSDYRNSTSSTIHGSSSSTSSKRRNTTSSLYGIVSSATSSSNHHNRSGSHDLRKLKRQEEKEQAQIQHYMQLIVKFNESVDGGYLAPFGTYKSNLDYDCDIVRNLIINRKLSPFFTPLQDFDESWTDDELCILLGQLTLHALEPGYNNDDDEEEDDIDNHKIHKSANYYKRQEEKAKLKSLINKVKELQKDEEQKYFDEKQKNFNKDCPSRDLLLRLYRNASECPICFLYYPKHLNISRCCLQPICSECFVQIKRLDPHPPHDDQSNQEAGELPHRLISEPANCPYCASPDFGVTYEPPIDIHTGIDGIKPGDYRVSPPIVEESELAIDDDGDNSSNGSTTGKGELNSNLAAAAATATATPPPVNSISPKKNSLKKRRGSLAANAPGVITIDMIRPDWETKLNSARSKLARKAATASAIHASNLLLDDNSNSNSNGNGNGNNSGNNRRRNNSSSGRSGSFGGSNNRYATVEQRMIEEAMRLSILDEEERKRNANKENKK